MKNSLLILACKELVNTRRTCVLYFGVCELLAPIPPTWKELLPIPLTWEELLPILLACEELVQIPLTCEKLVINSGV